MIENQTNAFLTRKSLSEQIQRSTTLMPAFKIKDIVNLLGHCITWQGRMCSGSPKSVQSRPPCCGSGLVQVRFLV